MVKPVLIGTSKLFFSQVESYPQEPSSLGEVGVPSLSVSKCLGLMPNCVFLLGTIPDESRALQIAAPARAIAGGIPGGSGGLLPTPPGLAQVEWILLKDLWGENTRLHSNTLKIITKKKQQESVYLFMNPRFGILGLGCNRCIAWYNTVQRIHVSPLFLTSFGFFIIIFVCMTLGWQLHFIWITEYSVLAQLKWHSTLPFFSPPCHFLCLPWHFLGDFRISFIQYGEYLQYFVHNIQRNSWHVKQILRTRFLRCFSFFPTSDKGKPKVPLDREEILFNHSVWKAIVPFLFWGLARPLWIKLFACQFISHCFIKWDVHSAVFWSQMLPLVLWQISLCGSAAKPCPSLNRVLNPNPTFSGSSCPGCCTSSHSRCIG